MGWAINGHRNATRWIEILEALMMVSNLQEATIVRWAHLFPKLRLLRRSHCWCPECHKEGIPTSFAEFAGTALGTLGGAFRSAGEASVVARTQPG